MPAKAKSQHAIDIAKFVMGLIKPVKLWVLFGKLERRVQRTIFLV